MCLCLLNYYQRTTRPVALVGQGSPWGPAGQGLAAWACPTTPARIKAAGGHQGRPSSGYWALPWGQTEAGPGHGLTGGPGSARPMAGQDNCWTMGEVEADPRGEGQGQSGLAVHKNDEVKCHR